MNWQLFTTFLVFTVVLILAPGPIVTLVIATSASRGPRAGLATVAGTSSGTALLLTAIALGLSWILSNAVYLFEVLRWGGAAYLLWLGVQAWRGGGSPAELAPQGGHVHFLRGMLVALSNPKTFAFFTAFLPQFVDPSLPVGRQLAVMCAASVALAAVSDSAWALIAGAGRLWFLKPSRTKLLARLSGLTLIGGGLWMLSRRPA
ncbi:MAG: LysE family translocator [Alphaproteobacteria bacterium]|nr:LysE family translocator [Alphaproteobacteria bacterium]